MGRGRRGSQGGVKGPHLDPLPIPKGRVSQGSLLQRGGYTRSWPEWIHCPYVQACVHPACAGLDTGAVNSLSLLQKRGWVRRELSSPRWLSLSFSLCALMTAQGGEELETDSHEGFPLLFNRPLSISSSVFAFVLPSPSFSFLHPFSSHKPFPQAQPSSLFFPSPPFLFYK